MEIWADFDSPIIIKPQNRNPLIVCNGYQNGSCFFDLSKFHVPATKLCGAIT